MATCIFYVQLNIETGFGLLPVNVMQTYGKKEETSVAFSSFSAFFFSLAFPGVAGMVKGT